jgi:hypothetical protein
MKRPFILLVWLVAAAAVMAEEAVRTWTDTQGRTLGGVFVEASAQEVIVRRPDGSIAHLPRTTLSADDLAYADKAQAAKPVVVTIDASRAKFTSKRTETPGTTTLVEDWGYGINLTNTTTLTGQNLRAVYQLYYRRVKEENQNLAAQPLTHQTGTETIAKLDPRGTTTFHTATVAVTTEQLKGAIFADTRSDTYVNTKFEGIWLRIYQGDQIVGEYVSSEDYRKDGWPGDGAGNRRRGGRAGAPAP